MAYRGRYWIPGISWHIEDATGYPGYHGISRALLDTRDIMAYRGRYWIPGISWHIEDATGYPGYHGISRTLLDTRDIMAYRGRYWMLPGYHGISDNSGGRGRWMRDPISELTWYTLYLVVLGEITLQTSTCWGSEITLQMWEYFGIFHKENILMSSNKHYILTSLFEINYGQESKLHVSLLITYGHMFNNMY